MITDIQGKFFTRRELPKMATIKTKITDGGLKLAAQRHGEIDAGFGPPPRAEQIVAIWDDKPKALKYETGVTNG